MPLPAIDDHHALLGERADPRSGDPESAVVPLRAALDRFDAAFCALPRCPPVSRPRRIATVLGHPAAASKELEQARALYPLAPWRVLADRLCCGCGELEDPIGAAAEL